MPWNIIMIPALACLAYGFLLGLKSHEVYHMKHKPESEEEDS